MPNAAYTANSIGDAAHLAVTGAATITSGAICLYEQGDLGTNDFKDSIRVHISPFILNNPSKPSGANIVQGAYKLNVADVVAIATVSEDTICAKDTTILIATGTSEGSTNGITFQWRTENTSSITTPSVILTPNFSRNYVLTVTDAFGCKDIDSVYVLV